jgi:uncharacterized protein
MEPRLSVITLQTANLPLSVGFYRSLGWTPAGPEMADAAFFQMNGLVLSIYAGQTRDAGLPPTDDAPSARISLAHNVRVRDELDPLVERMVAAGGRLVRAPCDTDWGGRSAYLADPDGHCGRSPGIPPGPSRTTGRSRPASTRSL